MPEFNILNEDAKKQYEDYLLYVKQRDPKTVHAVWNNINIFETFTAHADFSTIDQDQAKQFRRWLEKQKNKSGQLLSVSTIRTILNNVREFLAWLSALPRYRNKVDIRAVQFLTLSSNDNRAARASRDRQPPSVSDLHKALAAMPATNDMEKRDRALFALTILTGARAEAIISLKIKDIDPTAKTVWQDPKHVRTKRRKAILTRFVSQICPEAEPILLDWHSHATTALNLQPNDPLFPKTLVCPDPEALSFTAQGLSRDHWANSQPVRDIFKKAFLAVGLPYYHPHLLRKTIVKWGLKHCNQYEFKALSQNIGHEHAMTTYNSYGSLSSSEQIDTIAAMGNAVTDLQNIPANALAAELARRAHK